MTSENSTNDLGVLWGAAAIGGFINIDERKAYYLLENGVIDADKVGVGKRKQWTSTKARLQRQFGTPRVHSVDPASTTTNAHSPAPAQSPAIARRPISRRAQSAARRSRS